MWSKRNETKTNHIIKRMRGKSNFFVAAKKKHHIFIVAFQTDTESPTFTKDDTQAHTKCKASDNSTSTFFDVFLAHYLSCTHIELVVTVSYSCWAIEWVPRKHDHLCFVVLLSVFFAFYTNRKKSIIEPNEFTKIKNKINL